MKLQALVNSLSNMLATMPGDSTVYVNVHGNQEVAGSLTCQDTQDGRIIIIK